MHSPHIPSYLTNIDFLLPMHIDLLELDDPPTVAEIQVLCRLFRNRGILQFLQTARPESAYLGLMQSAAAYTHYLGRVGDEGKVTSFAQPFFDAVVGSYWDVARDIAAQSRTSAHLDYEYEDDFLYVFFLMHLFFLDGSPTLLDELLDRYVVVLEGAHDARYDLCVAMRDQDGARFHEHFLVLLENRTERLDGMIARGAIHEEDLAPVYPFYLEGIALVKLADRRGLAIDRYYKHVPEQMRGPSPYVFARDSWRRADFVPTARRS